MFWDTAGQEKYKAISRMHYKDSDGAVVVFDLTRKETFQSVPAWVEEIRDHTERKIEVLLLGNKLDVVKENPRKRQVDYEEALQYAEKEGFSYGEASAFDYGGVTEVMKKYLVLVKKQFEFAKGNRRDYSRLNSQSLGNRTEGGIKVEQRDDCC